MLYIDNLTCSPNPKSYWNRQFSPYQKIPINKQLYKVARTNIANFYILCYSFHYRNFWKSTLEKIPPLSLKKNNYFFSYKMKLKGRLYILIKTNYWTRLVCVVMTFKVTDQKLSLYFAQVTRYGHLKRKPIQYFCWSKLAIIKKI